MTGFYSVYLFKAARTFRKENIPPEFKRFYSVSLFKAARTLPLEKFSQTPKG
jgi:hypothetical protein